jgi:hypothetical protein
MREITRRSDCSLQCIAACAMLASFFLAAPADPSAWGQSGSGDQPTDPPDVAVVIGIGKLPGSLALTQPAVDAAAVADRLRGRGFQIISLGAGGKCDGGQPSVDLDREGMRAVVACFAKAAYGARQALLYFSGHSVNLEDRNYLVPAGIQVASSPSASALLDLKTILDPLEQARPALAMVVIDAARGAIKDFAGVMPGLSRVAATTSPRIVAYAAPVGAWAADDPAGGNPRRNQGGDRSDTGARDASDEALSSYTSRLVRALDDDLNARSLGQPGLDVRTLLARASDPGGSFPGRIGEITRENAAGTEMLGRMPKIGKSVCEVITWRAANIGDCIEVAAAYENCGKDAATRERLQIRCPADWKILVRHSLRASMVGAMQVKTCAALNELMTKFASEPSVKELEEFKEISSLAQYTCALEAKDKVKQQPSTAPVMPTDPNTRSLGANNAINNFLVSDNQDIWGQDIRQASGAIASASSDIGACATLCQSTATCVAISFDRWNGKCYLKSSAATSMLDIQSTIAVKKPLPLPRASSAKTEFQSLRNERFGKDPIVRKSVSNFDACRAACADELRCVAFTFLKSARNTENCELFRLTNVYERDPSADSGYKYQLRQ